MAAPNTVRYPKEFTVPSSTAQIETDYIRMDFIRRDYAKTDIQYKYEGGLNSIILNMPQKITETFTQNYQNAALGELGILDGFGNRQGTGAGAAGALGNMLKRVVENNLLDRAVSIGNKVGASGLSENGLLSGTSGIVFNPNLEVLYEGPDFRTFNFQFSMFTKSKDDAKSIKSIVDILKMASLPKRGFQQGFDISKTGLGNLITTASAAQASGEFGQGLGNLGSQYFQTKTNLGKKIYGPDQKSDFSGGIEKIFGGFVTGVTGVAGGFGVGNLIFSGKNRFITQPPLLHLRYMRGATEHPFIQSLMPAFINQVGFDYTPTGSYTQLSDYATAATKTAATTVGVNITLQLTEVTNLYRDDFDSDGQMKNPVKISQ